MKKRFLLAAGLLAGFTATVHAIVGTAEIHKPLLSAPLEESVSLVVYACWHLVTVTLFASSVALLQSSLPGRLSVSRPLVRFISVLWVLFAGVFAVVALAFSGPAALLVLPQWALLLPVGLLSWLGSSDSGAL